MRTTVNGPAIVWWLMLSQALTLSAAPLMVFVGGLVGKQLHPDPGFATLPVALMIIGTAVSAMPAARLAQRWGRKRVFLLAGVIGMAGSGVAVWGIQQHNFWLFCLAAVAFGVLIAVTQQSRFVAMDAVAADRKPVVAARLLLAGLASAFIGPELTRLDQLWSDAGFAGAFAGLGGLLLVSTLVLWLVLPALQLQQEYHDGDHRSLTTLLSQPVLWLAVAAAAGGYGLMAYIMTATPLSMTVQYGYELSDAKWVIQSHIAAMFLPSLISGQLIRRLGEWWMIVSGVAIYALTLCISWWDQTLVHYWLGLVLLGLGWNLLFVAGTSLLTRCYQPHEASRVQGLNDMLVFTAQALGALASGSVLLLLGWHGLLLSSIPLLLLMLVLLLRVTPGRLALAAQ